MIFDILFGWQVNSTVPYWEMFFIGTPMLIFGLNGIFEGLDKTRITKTVLKNIERGAKNASIKVTNKIYGEEN